MPRFGFMFDPGRALPNAASVLNGLPKPPSGFIFLTGSDGLPLTGADGALLYAKAS